MSLLHRRFVCPHCKRQISGCPANCPEPDHVEEPVECCAFCAKLPSDEKGKVETFSSKSMERRVKHMRAAKAAKAAPTEEAAATDVAEQTALKKLATGELW